MPSMLKEALAAAGRGMPVFPCHPNDKQPLVSSTRKGAGGVRLATTDAKQIRAWWKQWPDAMIGMRCGTRASGGAGIVVVDIDPKRGETGNSVLKRLALYVAEHHVAGDGESLRDFVDSVDRAMAYELPAPVIVKTPRGGLHLWYRVPDGLDLGNRGDLLKGRIEQIDVRGASRDEATGDYKPGYVIIPPSARRGAKAVAEGCDGVAYEWQRGGLADLIDMPAEIIELVRERQREAPIAGRVYTAAEAVAAIDASDARAAAIKKHVAAALEGELSRARSHKGNRNNDLNAAAVSLGKLIPGGFLIESEVRGLLEQEAFNNGLVKDDGLHTVRATIDSGIEYGKRNPRDLAEVGRLAGRSSRPPPATAAVHAENPSFDVDEDYAYASPAFDQNPRNPDNEWEDEPADSASGGGDDGGPPMAPPPDDDGRPTPIDGEKLALAATKEVNDTGNAERLLIWHGEEFLNVNIADAPGGTIGLHYWNGSHWQSDEAWEAIAKLAQKVPPLIQFEATLIQADESEATQIANAEGAATALSGAKAELAAAGEDREKRRPALERIGNLESLIEKGEIAKQAVQSRKNAKRKFGKSSGNKPRLEAMISLAKVHITWPPHAMDSDPLAINCRNGTLHLVQGPNGANGKPSWKAELRPHERTDRITKCMLADYDPTATAPRWLAFVEKVQPKADNLRFLQTWHGLGLTGLTEQAFVLNYGMGANGKTTFIETIADLQGGYSQTLPAEALVGDNQRRGDQATPDLAKLGGARLVRCGELPRGQGFRENVLKLLTGGDKVPVRHLHGRFFDLESKFKAVGQCNEKPDISGVDEGIWRRVKLVNWDVSIPPHERRPIKDVMAEFAAEGSGILNWLLDGLMAYLANGLIVPQDVLDATESYREDMDPVGSFEKACLRKVKESKVSAHAMYRAFAAYCHANSLRVMTQKNFGKFLKAKGYEKDRGVVFYYKDVELHDVPDDPNPDEGVRWSGGRYSRNRDDDGFVRRRMPAPPDQGPRPPVIDQPIGPYTRDELTDD